MDRSSLERKLAEDRLRFPDPARELGRPEVSKGIFGELFKGNKKRKRREKRERAS